MISIKEKKCFLFIHFSSVNPSKNELFGKMDEDGEREREKRPKKEREEEKKSLGKQDKKTDKRERAKKPKDQIQRTQDDKGMKCSSWARPFSGLNAGRTLKT